MIEPLSYPINLNNKLKIIKNAETDAKQPLIKFFNSITYVSHDKFKKNIKDKLSEVLNIKNKLNSNRPLYIYIDTNRYENYMYKSNYWIYTYIKYFLQNKNINCDIITSLNDDKIIDNDIVLLVDDCIYSGEQMSESIYSMNNKNKKHIKLLLFVQYMSENGKKTIENAFNSHSYLKNCEFIITKYNTIYPLKNKLSLEEGKQLFKYYMGTYNDNALTNYTISQMNKYNIYFDHKVGDFMSSYPIIFSGLVPNEKNRQNIIKYKDIEYNYFGKDKQVLIKEIEKQFELYPLLINCEHIKIPDFNVSSCPYPPYKEDYQFFLQRIKGISKKYQSFKLPNEKNNRSIDIRL